MPNYNKKYIIGLVVAYTICFFSYAVNNFFYLNKNKIDDSITRSKPKHKHKDKDNKGKLYGDDNMQNKHKTEFEPHQVYKFQIFKNEHKSPIIIEKYKLMWFLNTKVSSVSERFFLTRMSNPNVIHEEKRQTNLNDYQKLRDFVQLKDYSLQEATSILNDPEWTRVFILRDPKQHFLSLYLELEKKYHEEKKMSEFRRLCCDDKSTNGVRKCDEHEFTFNQFLQVTKTCKKSHYWDGQYDEVDDWRIINYPIKFDNLANDTERLLRKLGKKVWKTFGASGYGANGTSPVFQDDIHHLTGVNSKIEHYYTPSRDSRVRERFSKDYDLLRKYFPNDY